MSITYTDNFTIEDHLLQQCSSVEQFKRLSQILHVKRYWTKSGSASLEGYFELVAETNEDMDVLRRVLLDD